MDYKVLIAATLLSLFVAYCCFAGFWEQLGAYETEGISLALLFDAGLSLGLFFLFLHPALAALKELRRRLRNE